jgi:hypothetical protein
MYIYLISLIIVNKGVTSIVSRQNPFVSIFLHPIQMFVVLVLGFYSMYATLYNKLTWKERKILDETA